MQRLLQQKDFKTLFDSTLDAILVTDDNSICLAANPAACQLLKTSESAILGRSLNDFTPPEHRARLQDDWRKLLQRGQRTGEIELRCADDTRCIVEYRARANFIPGQHLSVLRDVTERKRAEAALADSSRQIVSIMESISDAVIAVDREWRITYANPQSEPLLERPPHELLGKVLWKEFPHLLGSVFEEQYHRAARESVPTHFQGYLPAPEIWVGAHVYPSDVGLTIYLRDISDHKQAEENLLFLSEAGAVLSASLEYDQVIRNLAELAISHIADWCAIDVLEDDQLKRLAVMHKDPAKVELAHEFRQRYPPDLNDSAGVAGVLRSGEAQLYEEITDALLERLAPNRRWRKLVRALGIRSAMRVPLIARGQTIGVMTLIREKSGRRYGASDLVVARELGRRAGTAVENGRLFRDLKSALHAAEEATRARDEFLAIVSHELKTPMTPILGWVGLLQDEAARDDSAALAHAMEVIERNVKAQAQLVNDLLDISRIVTGKMQLNTEPVDLAAVVRSAVETVRPAADAKSIAISLHIDKTARQVIGDAERLQQVAWNLLSNAIKFTPRAGAVNVSLQRAGSFIELTVRDSGQGIHHEMLPYVFDRFRQADSSNSRQHGGLGLGLSIVRNLIELHGGTVGVESPGLGLGSTFTVQLPIQALERKPALDAASGEFAGTRSNGGPNAGPARAAEFTAPSLEGLRVLVIEDMPDSRELVTAVLQRYGAAVYDVESASAGIAALRAWQPDIILCDIGMPGEDGYSFIQRVRALPEERGGQIPAIALTAYGRLEDRLKALSSGFQNHIVKPADTTELVITIASVAGRIGADASGAEKS